MVLYPTRKKAAKTLKKLKPYRDSWIKNNPDWFYMCWNLKNCKSLVKTFYTHHLEMYNNYPYIIQRCDAIRYFILHRYGGLYADMDYFCNKPWNEVLKEYRNDLYLVETPNNMGFDKTHISNSLMYSKTPGNVFWSKLFIELELKKNISYYNRHMTIMYTTGPCIVNRIFNNYRFSFKLNYYPYLLFHPYGLSTDIKILSNNSDIYAYHLGKGTWESKDSKIIIFLYQEYKILLPIILVLIIPLFIHK